MRQVRISRRRVRPADTHPDDVLAARPRPGATATVAATLRHIDEALAIS